MGTRGTIKIYNDNVFLLALYNSYDSYVEGLGNDIKSYIKKGKWVNGIPVSKDDLNETLYFNGIEDFALMLVLHLKQNSGGVYATIENDFEAYNYKINYISAIDEEEYDTIEIHCEEDKSYYEAYKIPRRI